MNCKKWYQNHIWDKWEEIEKSEIERSRDKVVVGTRYIQEKKCLRCGYRKRTREQILL